MNINIERKVNKESNLFNVWLYINSKNGETKFKFNIKTIIN
jgi:hypothetical protein